MTDLTKNRERPLTLAEVERMASSLPLLSGKYPTTPDQVSQTRAALDLISKPADESWIKGRIATLLVNYYVADLPDAMVRAIADDWLSELGEYPQWAIVKACAWWMSRHNPKRSKKPLPGDISEQVYRFCAPIRVGEVQIQRYEKYGNKPPAFIEGGSAAA